MIRRRTLLLSAPALSLAPAAALAQAMEVRLGTSTAGGGFVAYSVALLEALKAVDPVLDIRPVQTKGATENAELLQSGDIDIGLVGGEVMYEWIAKHPDQPRLKIISVLYSAPGMFAVRPETRYRKITDRVAVNHVSKIDQPGDCHALRIDEDVVIVRIAVNNTSSQLSRRLKPALQNQLTQIRVFNQWRILVDDAISIREVPMKISMHCRTIEVCECTRE